MGNLNASRSIKIDVRNEIVGIGLLPVSGLATGA